MKHVAARDEQAFAQFVRRFGPGLYSMVYEIVGEQAEDVLQEAFVQMWKRAASYEAARSSVFTWAVMIARHKAIDWLRARQRRERGAEIITREFQLTPEESEGEAGHIVAAQHEDRERVLGALSKLPAEQREAINLAFFSGLTHADIAGKLQTPLGTIKARIRRGLQSLQNFLRNP